MRAIDAEPSQRFPSANEFRQALSNARERVLRRRLSRRTALAGIAGLAGATWIAWPPARETRLAWKDVDRAQRLIGNTNNVEIGLSNEEGLLRFRLILSASTYRVEPQDVPSGFLDPIPTTDILSLRGSIGLLGRLAVKTMTLAIPEGVRLDDATAKVFTNPPSPQSENGHFLRFADACRWLDRIEDAGALLRTEDRLAIDPQRCPDYGMFCASLGVGSISVRDALTEAAQKEALFRIGAYQLLRQPESHPAPALAAGADFNLERFETRSPLEVIAGLVAEPWLLPKLPELPWRPLYDGSRGLKDPLNEPTVDAVEQMLENLS